MASSVTLTLMCLTLLLLHPAQGNKKWDELVHQTLGLACCPEVSTAYIRSPVNQCYIQHKHGIWDCPIHAYIFYTANSEYCVDPNAWWLPQRIETLKANGVHCKDL